MDDLRKSNIERRLYISALTAGLILIGIRMGYAVLLVRLVSQMEVADTSSPSVSTGKTSPREAPGARKTGLRVGGASGSAGSRATPGSSDPVRLLQELIESGDLDKAIKLCEKQSRAAAEGKWLAPLTWLYKETGQQQKARGCLHRVRSLHAYNPTYPSRLISFFIGCRMDQEAIETIEWFLQQDGPLAEDLYGMLIRLYAKHGRAQQLSITAAEVTHVNSGKTSFYCSTGRALLSVGKIDEGLVVLQKALRLTDTSTDKETCRSLLVQACISQGKVAEARRLWDSSFRDKSTSLTGAALFAGEGKWKEALSICSQKTGGKGLSPLEAICLCRVGEVRKIELGMAHAPSPNGMTLWAGRELGFHMVERGRPSEAAEAFLKALRGEVALPRHEIGSLPEDIDDPSQYSQQGEIMAIDSFVNVYDTARRNGWLGVQTDPQPQEGMPTGGHGRNAGTHICRVIPGSPAEKASLQPGDTIAEFSGQPITAEADWIKMLGDLSSGKRVSLKIQNGAQSKLVELTAGRCPE